MKSWGSARELILSVPGYTPEQELCILYFAAMLTSSLTGDIVEIGSWCGRSALAMAAGTDNAKIHCIDLFLNKDDWKQNSDGTWSSQSILDDGTLLKSHANPTVSNSVYINEVAPVYQQIPNMRDYFYSSITKAGKQNIIAHKGTSGTWAKSIPSDFKCRLAFIDGGHSYEEVIEDIKNIEPFLISGSWVLFDDVYAGFPGVDKAVKEMIIDNSSYDNVHHEIGRLLIARKI